MSIKKALVRTCILFAVSATIAIGQTTPAPAPAPVKSVKIGTLTWTTQNASVETPDSWCYANQPANCAKYGRLYTWESAKAACEGMGGGYRLPTNEDWKNIINHAGGEKAAGKKLKSKSGWDRCGGSDRDCVKNGNGTDDYGFAALPGGQRNVGGVSITAVAYGFYWSATEFGPYSAYNRLIDYHGGSVTEFNNDKGFGYSVRCVKE